METRSNHVLVGAVVLILLAVLAIFTVWIARLSGSSEKEYDIFFKQSVSGLANGSGVDFSGVPVGHGRGGIWTIALHMGTALAHVTPQIIERGQP